MAHHRGQCTPRPLPPHPCPIGTPAAPASPRAWAHYPPTEDPPVALPLSMGGQRVDSRTGAEFASTPKSGPPHPTSPALPETAKPVPRAPQTSPHFKDRKSRLGWGFLCSPHDRASSAPTPDRRAEGLGTVVGGPVAGRTTRRGKSEQQLPLVGGAHAQLHGSGWMCRGRRPRRPLGRLQGPHVQKWFLNTETFPGSGHKGTFPRDRVRQDQVQGHRPQYWEADPSNWGPCGKPVGHQSAALSRPAQCLALTVGGQMWRKRPSQRVGETRSGPPES